MKTYAIQVVSKKYEIRSLKLADILNIEYKPSTHKAYYIGMGDKTNKLPKFLNWYDNKEYIKKFSTKSEAENFLSNTLKEANDNYNTKKDPFNHLVKTKGDWKNYLFIVIEL